MGAELQGIRAVKPNVPVFDKRWRKECSVVKTGRDAVRHMIAQHYIGKWPGVCVLVLALLKDGAPLGVIVFALPPRETAKRYGGVTWELARLWVQNDAPQNTESYFISAAVKYVRLHHPSVEVLVSYADPSAKHTGVIYKAANWTADGKTDQERKTPRFDYADAGSGKRYSRRSHVPAGAAIFRVPRVSKHRFFYRLR